MSDEAGWEYYAAIVASGVSLLAWIAAVVAAVASLYHLVTGGPVQRYALWTVVTVTVAIGTALLEKRLYRIDVGERS